MNLATATSRDVDVQLMALAVRELDQQQQLTRATEEIHRGSGDRQSGYGRRRDWGMTHEDALARAQVAAEKDPAGTVYPESARIESARRGLQRLQDTQAALKALEAEAAPLHAEYRKRPWTRYWNVAGGHVHSDDQCQTLHHRGRRTPLGWMPELSGLSMPEAIAHFEAMGSGRSVVLCTVCMPDAPTDLFAKPVDQAVCPSGGTSNYSSHPKHSSRYGICRTCDTAVALTPTGVLRKHKRPEPARSVVVSAATD